MSQKKHQVLSPTSSKKSYTHHTDSTSRHRTLLVHVQEHVIIAIEMHGHREFWNFYIL